MILLQELQAQTGNVPDLQKLGELLGENFVPDKALATFNAVLSLPGRVKTMKDLGDTLYKLIGLERDAYNIGSGGETPPGSGQVVAVDPQQIANALRARLAACRSTTSLNTFVSGGIVLSQWPSELTLARRYPPIACGNDPRSDVAIDSSHGTLVLRRWPESLEIFWEW